MIGFGGNYARPRLFNWITILLITAWVALVGVIAETSQSRTHSETGTVKAFVDSLAK